MAPMTRMFSPNGIPAPETGDYYQRRAEGGAGLIITEGVGINRPAARPNDRVPNLFGDALPAWKQVVEKVHSAHGVIAPQLWHAGARRGPTRDWRPLGTVDSPSGIDRPSDQIYDPLTEEGISDVLASYEASARCAREVGFDAIEIHAAHGYLIDQFFWPGTNRRADRWNGPCIADRAHFGAEVVKAVRRGVGGSTPIIIRLSQWKLQEYGAKIAGSPDELARWLAPLSDAGADVFHCSQRRFWEPEFAGSDLTFSGWTKKLSGKPVITVGSVGLDGEFISGLRGESARPASLDGLLRRLAQEEFDLVAVGRALLADPEWPRKIKEGRHSELLSFDRSCLDILH